MEHTRCAKNLRLVRWNYGHLGEFNTTVLKHVGDLSTLVLEMIHS